MNEVKHVNPGNITAPRIFLTTSGKIAAFLNIDTHTFYAIKTGRIEPCEILAEGLEKATGIPKSEWIAPYYQRHIDIEATVRALLAKEKEEEMNFITGKAFSHNSKAYLIDRKMRTKCEIRDSL
jgi:hypothetical protein